MPTFQWLRGMLNAGLIGMIMLCLVAYGLLTVTFVASLALAARRPVPLANNSTESAQSAENGQRQREGTNLHNAA